MTHTPETILNCMVNDLPFDAHHIELGTLFSALNNFEMDCHIEGMKNPVAGAEERAYRALMTGIERFEKNFDQLSPQDREAFSNSIVQFTIGIADTSKKLQAREQAFPLLTPNDKIDTLRDIWEEIEDNLEFQNTHEEHELYLQQEIPSLLQRLLPPKADTTAWTNADLLSQRVEIHYTPPRGAPKNAFDGLHCYLVPKSPPSAPSPPEL